MRVRNQGQRCRGFTLAEIMVTATLIVVLMMLLCNAWSGFGPPALSAVARARLAQEANLAAEALSRDIGSLAAPSGTQTDSRYQNVQANGTSLSMTLDQGNGVQQNVTYAIDNADPGKLFRIDSSGKRVVATLVSDFQSKSTTMPLMQDGSSVSGVRIDLTLSHRVLEKVSDGSILGDHTRSYTLFIPDP